MSGKMKILTVTDVDSRTGVYTIDVVPVKRPGTWKGRNVIRHKGEMI